MDEKLFSIYDIKTVANHNDVNIVNYCLKNGWILLHVGTCTYPGESEIIYSIGHLSENPPRIELSAEYEENGVVFR